MIERHLKTVIDNAFAQIQKVPELLDDLFVEQLDLEQNEVDVVKKLFFQAAPTVIHGYPRSDHEFPLVSITLGNESAQSDFLGNEATTEDDPNEPDFMEDASSNFWDHSYKIYCYTQHPDYTRYLYEVVKQALVLNIPDFFKEKNLWNVSIVGSELAPDARYAPEILFLRLITFRCNDEFKVVKKGSRTGKAFRVSGISVDKSGSSSDVGGVKTNVKVTAG